MRLDEVFCGPCKLIMKKLKRTILRARVMCSPVCPYYRFVQNSKKKENHHLHLRFHLHHHHHHQIMHIRGITAQHKFYASGNLWWEPRMSTLPPVARVVAIKFTNPCTQHIPGFSTGFWSTWNLMRCTRMLVNKRCQRVLINNHEILVS